MKTKKIQIELPNGFMNVGISNDNYLYADTNNSANWDTLKFPLPNGQFGIESINGKIVTLYKK